jgi:hypothetical protein
LDELSTYLANQGDRLAHDRFRAAGYDIASGRRKHVMALRTKRSGTRRPDGGARVALSLRVVRLNGWRERFRATKPLLAPAPALYGQRVVLGATATFDRDGLMVLLEADAMGLAGEKDAFFSRMPEPVPQRWGLNHPRQPQAGGNGVNAIWGKWPGDKTDEQIEQALRELS